VALALAIIGHRDLRPGDLPAIQSSLCDWWSTSTARFKGNRPTLMTSLAPGADQVGAWVLTGTTVSLPASLRPVFPYGEAPYSEEVRRQERTYNPPGCPWSFDALADDRARTAAVRRNVNWTTATTAQAEADCYRDAGHYLAEHADVLIALWDGNYAVDSGGTSDTLLYALSPECQKARASKGRTPLEVHWLAVPRVSNPHPAGEAFTWQRLSVPSPAVRPVLKAPRRHARKGLVVLPIALAVASVACSMTGYYLNFSSGEAADARVFLDKALIAIGHVSQKYFESDIAGPGALLIRIGRWLGVGFILSTLASVMNGLFRWMDDLALRSVRSRGHDLVCGLGWRGRAFIADSAPDNTPTIAVEHLPDEGMRDACASTNVPLVEGDATDPETIGKIGLSRVRRVFVACSDDETNMQVVYQLARIPHDDHMVCCVALQSQRRFQVLENALSNTQRLDLRIFNAESVTARMLLRAHTIDRLAASPDAPGAKVILLGNSPMAEELLRQVLQQGIFEDGKELAVVWLTPDAAATCQTFTSQYPVYQTAGRPGVGEPWIANPPKVWLEDEKVLPGILFYDLPPSERALMELFERQILLSTDSWVTSVFVAIEDPAESAAVAHALAPHLEALRRGARRDITLACYYNTPEDIFRGAIERVLNRDFQALPARVFSDFMGDCSRAVVLGDELDRVARRVNGIYSKPVPAKPFGTHCDEIWLDISENDKDSSRQAGAHAWVKHRIRQRLRARKLDNATIDDALARIEHRRWCAEYLLKGFRPLTRIPSEFPSFAPTAEEVELIARWFGGAKRSLKLARRHADLVPFDDFVKLFPPDRAAEEVTKDLDQVKKLDLLLK
jgi:voltage-gated potassium channel Kch